MKWKGYGNNLILDEDTDEVLLLLLAKDCEPVPKRDKPHRRYIAPQLNWEVDNKYNALCYPKWKTIAYDWYVREGDSYGQPKV